MRKLYAYLKGLFGSKNKYYLLLTQDAYDDAEHGVGTYAGFVFASYEDAMRHSLDVEQYNKSYKPLGIVEIETTMPVTTAELNYTRTDAHPAPTVTFKGR